MEVILEEDVPKLGEMGEVVEVAPGYGRNYLLPQGLAKHATPGRKKEIEHRKRMIDARREEMIEEAKKIREDLDGISITIPARVSSSDTLYGSIGATDISDALEEEGFKVKPKQVRVEENFGELGIYEVPIRLASGVFAEVRIWIVAM